jgi:hypothetical protein
MSLAVLAGAVVLLFNGCLDYLKQKLPAAETMFSVSALTLLLFASIAAARVPHLLVPKVRHRMFAAICWITAAIGFLFVALNHDLERAIYILPVVKDDRFSSAFFIVVATALAAVLAWVVPREPPWGRRALVIWGAAGAACLATAFIVHAASGASPWFMFAGCAAFVYLWWVVILLFDVAFIWHRYVRRSVAVQNLKSWHNAPTRDLAAMKTKARETLEALARAAALSKPTVFISYRRDDSQHMTDRIHDRLVGKFTSFRDIDNIPAGVDFGVRMTAAVEQSDVFLLVIGPDWVTVANRAGRRLDQDNDAVRQEIDTAHTSGVPILPVLVDDAVMPAASELPASIAWLSKINALRVRPDPDFNGDIELLLALLAQHARARRSPRAQVASSNAAGSAQAPSN